MPSRFRCVACVFFSVALQSSLVLAQEEVPQMSDAPEEAPLDAEQLFGALVEYRTAWHSGRGFLIGDRRTVVVSCLRQRYRRITVRMAGTDTPEVRVANIRASDSEREVDSEQYQALAVLTLESDLPGTPLPVSALHPELEDTVWFVARRQGDRDEDDPESLEIGRTSVTAASASSLSVGTSAGQQWAGAPLVDDAGAVVAFMGTGGRAPRSRDVLSQETLEPHRQVVSPLLGFRLGTVFGLSGNPQLSLEIEGGITLFDQLGIAVRLGGTIGASALQSLPASDGHEQGVVSTTSSSLLLGFELRYRLLLARLSFPLYLDFAVGLTYMATFTESSDLAFYATEPGCDPLGGACGLTAGEGPGSEVSHGLGPSFGVDFRAGPLVIGYRVTPSAISHNLPTTHWLTFGIAF